MAIEPPKKTPSPKFIFPSPRQIPPEDKGEPEAQAPPPSDPKTPSPPSSASEPEPSSPTSEAGQGSDEADEVYMPAEPLGKPRIRDLPGEIHRMAAAAERVLVSDGNYFHAGGPLVRVINRPGAGVMSEQVNDQTLTTALSSKIDWEKKGRTIGDWVRCDPPQKVVQNLLRGQDRPYLKPLAGLVRQPFYGPDGSLITKPGYHEKTGIYGVFDSADYRLDEPTREMAEHSLAYSKWLIDEFPFASDIDRSAALAAMLTATIRSSLPQAPAFNITATRFGSGKSYLANLIALFAGPGDPYNVSYPVKAEEASKVVLAMLLEKPAVILFDDMQTDWKSFGALNKALTSPTTTERVLGSSRTATARTNVLWLGTGNNIEPEQDMRRRVVSIRLAPRGETPALNRYRNDRPMDEVRKDRAYAVKAALAIIGAFVAAGSPLADVKPIGTFDGWSTLCRQPLIWLGESDPGQSLIDQVTHDSDQEALGNFLDVWWRIFGASDITVRKIIAKAYESPELMDALAELPVMDRRDPNHHKLGWYLKKNRGRRADQCRIETGKSSERRSWRVIVDD